MKKRPITRKEARERAYRYLLRKMFTGAVVKDGAKAEWRPSYPQGGIQKEDVWLIYLREFPAKPIFRSSHVIVVSKKSGRVVYDGSANDEG